MNRKTGPVLLALLSGLGWARAAVPDEGPASVRLLWERFRQTLPPVSFEVLDDRVVPSDTDPRQKLRRVELKFYSQEIQGRKWGHPAVVFIPADRKAMDGPDRRGKIVVVGQRSWDGLATGPWRDAYLGNYGEPIASRTGYPTMVCPVPGEYDDGFPGREISIGFLTELRKKTNDPVDHPYFRLAVPYLRALDVMADLLGWDRAGIRAVIGGHSKRATSAYTAAAADPGRVAGVVYMGNESTWEGYDGTPWQAVAPSFTKSGVRAAVLYIGGTNEDGYRMFNINRIQELMDSRWTVALIPNYRHSSMSEKHFLDWPMWIAHVFDGRPVAAIDELSFRTVDEGFVWGGEPVEAGTLFRARVNSPNKIIQVKVWYVTCDDVPYWRDLVWYPEFMIPAEDGFYQGYVKGRLPDAWLVEVKDTAGGFPGYITSLPRDITGLETKTRVSRGSRSRRWEPVKKKSGGSDS